MRSIKVLIGCFGLVAVMTAAPIEYSSDDRSVGLKAAAANPGNGKGKGRGNGHGVGRGGQSFADGQTEDGASHGQANGRANGQANGRALGHADKDAVSGVEHAPAGHAKKEAYDGVKGSINAMHSAAINKGVVSPNSRVARVKAYLDAAQEVSDIENAEGQIDQAALEAAMEDAAMKAAYASSQPVTAEMLDQVNDYSNERALTDPGIDMDPQTTKDVAERAQDIQSGP